MYVYAYILPLCHGMDADHTYVRHTRVPVIYLISDANVIRSVARIKIARGIHVCADDRVHNERTTQPIIELEVNVIRLLSHTGQYVAAQHSMYTQYYSAININNLSTTNNKYD